MGNWEALKTLAFRLRRLEFKSSHHLRFQTISQTQTKNRKALTEWKLPINKLTLSRFVFPNLHRGKAARKSVTGREKFAPPPWLEVFHATMTFFSRRLTAPSHCFSCCSRSGKSFASLEKFQRGRGVAFCGCIVKTWTNELSHQLWVSECVLCAFCLGISSWVMLLPSLRLCELCSMKWQLRGKLSRKKFSWKSSVNTVSLCWVTRKWQQCGRERTFRHYAKAVLG